MSRMHRTGWVLGPVVLAGLLSAGLVAQTAKPEPPQEAKPQTGRQPNEATESPAQLRVQVTVARYADGKKTASLPFTLWVSADGNPTSLNVGQRIPFPADKWEYQNIGTSINCSARAQPDGRFMLNLQLRDSHAAPRDASGGGPATLKSIEAINRLLLRDGQTAEFVASTDLVTGEVTRIEVTASVLK